MREDRQANLAEVRKELASAKSEVRKLKKKLQKKIEDSEFYRNWLRQIVGPKHPSMKARK